MAEPLQSNDPLNPVYRQDPGAPQPVKPIGRLGSKSNLAVLIALIAVMLALYVIFGREKPATLTTPAQMETDHTPER